MNKRLFFVLISVCMWSFAVAQTNLREGSVFTLEGDTLHGSIEYRTDKINETRCRFIQDGSSEYKVYLPGEIKGYRFLDNGRYYVTMSVEKVDPYGKKNIETYFVEYVVRGKMSLYQLTSDNLFIVETDEGQMAAFHSLDAAQASNHNASRKDKERVMALVKPSFKASRLLQSAYNLNQTRDVVLAYNDETCPDGVCEIFEYPAKTTPKADRNMHWVVKAGVQITRMDLCKQLNKLWKAYKYKYPTFVSPTVEVGLDSHLDRLWQGLMVQAAVGSSLLSVEDGDSNFKAILADIKVGAGYQFDLGRVKPFVRVGYQIDTYMKFRYSCPKIYDNNMKSRRAVEITPGGLYFGGGVEVPLQKGALVIDCAFNRIDFIPLNLDTRFNIDRMDCMVGYKF